MGSNSKTLGLVLVVLFLIPIVTFHPVTVKAQTKTLVVPDQYLTIQQAIDNSSAGDTIYVKSGDYNITAGNYNLFGDEGLFINKSISLVGENCKNTIIRTSQIVSYGEGIEVTANNASISGFTIIGNTNIVALYGNSDYIGQNIINFTSYLSSGDAVEEFGLGNTISSNTIYGATQGLSSLNEIINGVATNYMVGSGTVGIDSSASKDGSIANNAINNFGIGLITGKTDIMNNTIADCGLAIYILENPTSIYGNNLVNYSQFSIYSGLNNVNATNNWWGTNDTQVINTKIIHSLNNQPEGNVTFIPFLTEPNPHAMPLTPSPTSTVPELPYCILLIVFFFGTITVIALISKKRGQYFTPPKTT